ncbi:helix-turn-helix domain-containing protein [Nocardia fluminea]|uniref:helix-turn-helix domain-containing protein n=1 Tax=Nocardia fluminea TaxID=134984 RepID=UPI0036685758
MTITDTTAEVGDRVRATRRLRGWNQERLALEMGMSVQTVRGVEQKRNPASPAFKAAASRALKVTVAYLDGALVMDTPDDREIAGGLNDIRRELAAWRIPPTGETNVRTIAELAADVRRTSRMRHAVNLAGMAAELPPLLAELRHAWHHYEGTDREKVFGLAAEAYASTGQLAWKLREGDLSSICVDRYEWAAEKSGDLLAVLAGDYQRAGEFLGTADWNVALSFLENSRSLIESDLPKGDPATWAMFGNLHLKSGLAAARAGDQATADAHLVEARAAADRIGVDRDDYRLCFGPTNTAIWGVGLAVESMNGTEAIKRAEGVTFPAGTQVERIAHYWIDLARGFLLHGDRERSFAALREAKRVSPTMTRYHPTVIDTVRALAHADRRRTDSLRGFAAWAGIRTV